jgi:hypothetical protein
MNDAIGHNRVNEQTPAIFFQATFPSIKETNVEVWIIRSFNQKGGNHVTTGFALLPRDYLMNTKLESLCLDGLFKAL